MHVMPLLDSGFPNNKNKNINWLLGGDCHLTDFWYRPSTTPIVNYNKAYYAANESSHFQGQMMKRPRYSLNGNRSVLRFQ